MFPKVHTRLWLRLSPRRRRGGLWLRLSPRRRRGGQPVVPKTFPRRLVTVVLPLVPVIAITVAGQSDQDSSISLTTGIFNSSAQRSACDLLLTPGELTTRSLFLMKSRECPPVSR